LKLEQATAWSLLPLLTFSFLSVATVPIYYHSLGTDYYALWFAIQTMTGTFGFMDLGLGVATGRFVGIALGRGDFAEARETWASGNLLNLVLLFLMALAFGIFGSSLGRHWFSFSSFADSLFAQCVWWSALGLFLNYYSQGWQVLLQAHLEFRWLALNRTIFALLTGVGMAWCAWTFRSPLPCIMFGAAVTGIQLVLLVYRATSAYHMGPLFSLARWSRLKEMASYTAKTFLSLLSGAGLGSLDRWLLGRIAGSDSFVAYNIGSNLAARVQGLSVAAMGPIFHGSSRGVGEGDRGRLAEIYLQSFRMMFPFYFAGALWATVWQLPWLQLWLGPESGARVASVLPFLLWGAAWSALMNISGAQLGPLNLLGFGTLIQSSSWLLSGLLVWVGWNGAGLAGAGAGLMAGRGLLFLQDARIRKVLGISIFDRRLFTRFLCIALLMVMFWIPSAMLPSCREISLFLSIANLLILVGLLFWLPPFRQKKN
jgi:O-antigen/teichoic acid export membrane protein